MTTTQDLFDEAVEAYKRLESVVAHTPLMRNNNLSELYDADIFLKREDLQLVRSYKLRGAYNKMSTLNQASKEVGIVCASAGNHAQGVAYSCRLLQVKGKIFMPITTPKQKISQVQLYGREWIEIVLFGDTFDDAYHQALKVCTAENSTFIHPFDDEQVIAGQATVGMEILNNIESKIDYVFAPIGGGGLIAGLTTVFKKLSPTTQIIGVEPEGAASMKTSLEKGEVTELDSIDKFVDGAAVKRVGNLTFETVKNHISDIVLVPEGKVCTTILKLYNEEAIVVEPAGALSISALDFYKDKIKGKTVVCIISGSNNDILRTEEIKERSLLYEGLKHYFILQFPQRPGALKQFVSEILGPTDDITYFQFSQKTNRESGPAVIGIEVKKREDFDKVKTQMTENNFKFTYLNETPDLFTHLIG
ncbi:MAG: threonine ammonia-lyase IlvA [Cloacibacterium sp.]|jgi:threonine dehydratase|nr:threonine ammonia-lyase IlvA [Cloacibacterium sp.]